MYNLNMNRYITAQWFKDTFLYSAIDPKKLTEPQMNFAIQQASSRVNTITGGAISKGIRDGYYTYDEKTGLKLNEANFPSSEAARLAEAKDATQAIYEQTGAMTKFAIETGWDFISGSFSSSLGSQSDSEQLDFDTSLAAIEKTVREALNIYNLTMLLSTEELDISFNNDDEETNPIPANERPLTEEALWNRLNDKNWFTAKDGVEVGPNKDGSPSKGIYIKMEPATLALLNKLASLRVITNINTGATKELSQFLNNKIINPNIKYITKQFTDGVDFTTTAQLFNLIVGDELITINFQAEQAGVNPKSFTGNVITRAIDYIELTNRLGDRLEFINNVWSYEKGEISDPDKQFTDGSGAHREFKSGVEDTSIQATDKNNEYIRIRVENGVPRLEWGVGGFEYNIPAFQISGPDKSFSNGDLGAGTRTLVGFGDEAKIVLEHINSNSQLSSYANNSGGFIELFKGGITYTVDIEKLSENPFGFNSGDEKFRMQQTTENIYSIGIHQTDNNSKFAIAMVLDDPYFAIQKNGGLTELIGISDLAQKNEDNRFGKYVKTTYNNGIVRDYWAQIKYSFDNDLPIIYKSEGQHYHRVVMFNNLYGRTWIIDNNGVTTNIKDVDLSADPARKLILYNERPATFKKNIPDPFKNKGGK